MITAFYTPYCKFLQKDNYIKFFDEVNSLQELIRKIKVTDKIDIYAYSRDIIKFQFFNTDSSLDVSYYFLEEERIFTDVIRIVSGAAKAIVRDEWKNILGEKVYLIQDREKQMNIVKEKDILAFQFTDLVDLVKNLFNLGDIGTELVVKMNCTDEEIKRENLLDKKIISNIK